MNKPNLLLSKHSLAIHKIYIMNCKYHLCTRIQFIIEALEQGRILVVDELDSSIHFKLTRAIVAMFNNELNTSAPFLYFPITSVVSLTPCCAVKSASEYTYTPSSSL